MDVTKLVPEPLLKQVVSVLNPRRIILFGSRARGEAGADSDYDLVAVLDDDAGDEMLSSRRSFEARRGIHLPIDILACREGALNDGARAIGSLAHTVLNEGIVVYERP